VAGNHQNPAGLPFPDKAGRGVGGELSIPLLQSERIRLSLPFVIAVANWELAHLVAIYRLIAMMIQLNRTPPAVEWHRVVWSFGPNLSAPSYGSSFESRARARLTRLLTVPTTLSPIASPPRSL